MFFSTLLSFSTLLGLGLTQGFGSKSTIFPLSTDSQFSFSLQSQLARGAGGGSSSAEVLTAAANITAGDFESFYRAFNYLGTHIYETAQNVSSEKYPVSAREAYFRSANYFRESIFFLYGNISDPRLYSVWDQQMAAFNQAIALLPVPGYRITVPSDGFEIPVIFYPASDSDEKRPTLLVGTGYDGAQEDLLHFMGFEALSRGYNFATYEGPGQPTVRRDQQIGFTPQWEKAVTPVVDYLCAHPKVDADAIALVGVSFGGQLTPRAAAHEPRLAAVILLDGLWSMFDILIAGWPTDFVQLYNSSNSQVFDQEVLAAAANSSWPTDFRWFVDQGLWAFNTRSPYDLLQQFTQYALTTELLQNITCPVFVGMGMDDNASIQAPHVAAALGEKATLFKFGADQQGPTALSFMTPKKSKHHERIAIPHANYILTSPPIMATLGANGKAAPSDEESTIKVAPKKDMKEKLIGTIKLKKPPPKHNKPGNWRDGSIIDEEKKKGTDTPSTTFVPASPGPVVNPLDESARETFATGRPLEDNLEIQQCKHCKKSILKTTIKAHVVACLKAKKEKAQRKKEQKEAREREKKGLGEEKKDDDGDTKMEDDDDDDSISPEKKGPEGLKSAKKTAGKKVEIDDGTKKGKKRKADGDAEKGPKPKKKKEEPKLKAPKPKGPVDVERQCGVMKDGVPCARSLTCKSHSMGAKRAVPGRSLPYDMLLTAYQKKNQAKQQKAAIDANAPLEDEEAANGPVDSDEELTAVMHGLSNWNPQPVVPPLIHIPIEKQYMRQRLYEQLHNATNGFTVNIFKVVGDGAKKRPNGDTIHVDGDGDAEGEIDQGFGMAASRRPSGFNIQMPPQRKTSATSQR
ncbi:hypothetical protein G7Y89_g3467 [Cudoniella acicularis]|uniref:SCA7 domain-containing protein n=1 Tax=Cudoniella acicularis TaxID=354080 RepID=A0A8H4W562_9HELO|nr:hypothetical protein G7Y89_g3467 [Cudoniella acicularis]